MLRPSSCSALFPSTTLFRSDACVGFSHGLVRRDLHEELFQRRAFQFDFPQRPAVLNHRSRDFLTNVVAILLPDRRDRKSTRLNSSHLVTSYAVFCLKKQK